jgi:hypothetical protein
MCNDSSSGWSPPSPTWSSTTPKAQVTFASQRLMTTNSKTSATASPTATTATVSALPSSGDHSLTGPITLVAVLVLVDSGLTALRPLRRGFS